MLRLLNAFSGQPRPMSRAELEKLSGLPQATVNRAIQTLLGRHLLRCVERGHRPTYAAVDPSAVMQLAAAMARLFPEVAPQRGIEGEMPWTERLRSGQRQPLGASRVDPKLATDSDSAERERFIAELPPVRRETPRVRAPFQGQQR